MQICTTIKSIEQKTPQIKSIVLEYGDEDFRFYPGQWIDVHLSIDDESHNSCYSITSIPSSRRCIEIAVKLAPDFPITRHLHRNSKAGDRIFISRAQGDLYLDNNIAGPFVFIAGGIGITPLYSMIRHLLAHKTREPVVLLYSIATRDEFLFETELRTLQDQHENFRVITTVTRNGNGNNNRRSCYGRINRDMLLSTQLPPRANYYLCGPPPMVDAVVEMLEGLLEELEITGDHIHYDKWWS
ncbi:MAG: FAD-dependent oxidoreductase [Gammaproteobacteria bacterium]|jgi:ferredoxin-NADP reductase